MSGMHDQGKQCMSAPVRMRALGFFPPMHEACGRHMQKAGGPRSPPHHAALLAVVYSASRETPGACSCPLPPVLPPWCSAAAAASRQFTESHIALLGSPCSCPAPYSTGREFALLRSAGLATMQTTCPLVLDSAQGRLRHYTPKKKMLASHACIVEGALWASAPPSSLVLMLIPWALAAPCWGCGEKGAVGHTRNGSRKL